MALRRNQRAPRPGTGRRDRESPHAEGALPTPYGSREEVLEEAMAEQRKTEAAHGSTPAADPSQRTGLNGSSTFGRSSGRSWARTWARSPAGSRSSTGTRALQSSSRPVGGRDPGAGDRRRHAGRR